MSAPRSSSHSWPDGTSFSNRRLWLLLVLLPSLHLVSSSQNCSFDVAQDKLVCLLRTLNSSKNSSFIFPSATKTRQIGVQCSDVFFYESTLRTNMLGYLPDLEILTLTFCKIRKVPALAFSGLPNLRELSIQTHNSEWSAMVMEVEADAFTGLNQLHSLNFTHNNLWTLPSATFCSLNSLIRLNLSVNYLQDVTELGFGADDLRVCRLPVEVLDLSFNSLSKLAAKPFGQLASLKFLLLQGNNLNVLEDAAFGGLNSLQTLNLAHNQLTALPPDLFRDPSGSLQELYLQNNSLSVLAPGIFAPLTNLLILNLSRNELGHEWLNADVFMNQERLVALDLSHNRLNKLDRNVFSGLVSLQILNLKNNAIHTVEPNTFSRQQNLHILWLSHNELQTLNVRTLTHLSSLNSLSLDHNQLANLHRNALKNCTILQDVALNNNQFTSVPKAIRSLSMLRTLDIGENAIGTVKNSSFEGLDNLYGLSLSGNGITDLEPGLFDHTPSLQVLNLAHNQLTKIDQNTFNPLVELRMLRLDNNKLEDINGMLTAQSELRWLNISANHLQWFDYAFIPKNLQWLDIHQNDIEELGNYYALKGGFSLQSLDASQNRITRLTALSLPTSLEYVFLNDNHIHTIEPNTFIEKPNLLRVEMTGNNIKHLQLSAFSISPKQEGNVPEFYIGGNSFFCDCEMEWLQKINQMAHHRQYPRVMDLDKVLCRLNNKRDQTALFPITSIDKSEFLCPYQAHCFALCMCCAFFACDCRMQCPDGCSCFRDSTWSANVIQCSLRGHIDIPPLIPMDATSIYLDGNNFTGILESQAFIGRKRVIHLYLNASRIAAISNQTFNGLTELEILHLEDNLIRRLEGYEFGNLTSLKKLFLQRNRLVFIDISTFAPLGALQELYIHDNLLTVFPVWQLPAFTAPLTSLTLSGNTWSCRCDFFKRLQEFFRNSDTDLLLDHDLIECRSDSGSYFALRDNATCTDAMAVTLSSDETLNHIVPIAVSVVALVVVIVVVSLIVFVFRNPLKVWLHSRYGVRLFNSCGGHTNRDKLYDAFVSYSLKDAEFVQQILVPQLEHEQPGYKLCLQYRDMPSNSSIVDTLPGISRLCSKQILVVSRSYLELEWAQVKYALHDMSKKWKPIVVLLDEPSLLDLAAVPEFNLLLKTAVVARWHEAGFWNKLRYYLPDTSMLTYSRRGGHHLTGSGKNESMTAGGGVGVGGVGGVGGGKAPLSVANHSSSTSTRSTVMGGSPRTLSGSDNNSSSSNSNKGDMSGQLLSNPLDPLSCVPNQADHWSDRSDSAYSWQDHTYQTIGGHPVLRNRDGHIYHTLDPDETTKFDNLGSLDVMLPNGQMVPATLVRNASGRIVPVVQMNRSGGLSSTSSVATVTTMTATPTPKRTANQVTFPKTVIYTPQPVRNGGGYLV